MQVKISLEDLTIDEIIKKFRALKNDSSIIEMTLLIRRKNSSDSPQQNKLLNRTGMGSKTQYGPNNVKKLYDKRHVSKQNSAKEIKLNNKDDKNLQPFKENRKVSIQTENVFHKSQTKANSINFLTDKRVKTGIKYYDTGNFDQALKIFLQIKEQYEKMLEKLIFPLSNQEKDQNENIELKRNISNITFYIANCFFKKKKLDRAIQFYQIDYEQESPKQKGLRKGNLATCYAYQQKNQNALCLFKQALNILNGFQQMDLSNIYYNVGIIYLIEKMPEAAVKYLKYSIQQRKQKSPENQDMLFNSYFKLGRALRQSNSIQEALKILIRAESFAQRGINGSKNSLFQVEKQIALCYECLQKWKQAFTYYESMLNKVEDNILGKAYLYYRVSEIYRINGNFNQMKKCLKISSDEYEKAGDLSKAEEIRQSIND